MKESERERVSDPLGPRVMGRCSREHRPSVDRGTDGPGIELRNTCPVATARDLWSADALETRGRQHRRRRYREAPEDSTRSETPSTYGRTAHGSREIPRSAASRDAVRIGKSKDERR